jgi:hypothetical protein
MDGTDSGPTTTVGVTSTLAETALAADDGDALTDEEIAAICAEADNHGEAVSTVAKHDGAQGREHGELVSKVAQSNCGKTDDDDDSESDEPTATEADDTPALTDEEIAAICAEADNHGEGVSTVAKHEGAQGSEHGELVSKVAKSDCGKDGGDDEEETIASANTNKAKKNKKNVGVQGS